MSVLPSHRGKGIGNLLMSWGMQKAEELDYQVWMEATEMGRGLYKKFGFRVLFKLAFDSYKENPSATWLKLQEERTPDSFYPMWKAAKSQKFEDGMELPWKELAQSDELTR